MVVQFKRQAVGLVIVLVDNKVVYFLLSVNLMSLSDNL